MTDVIKYLYCLIICTKSSKLIILLVAFSELYSFAQSLDNITDQDAILINGFVSTNQVINIHPSDSGYITDYSINIDDVIAVHIEQNMNIEREYRHSINLFIHNQQLDTIRIRSSFVLDEPQMPSHILVYSCKDVKDSLICDYDWSRPGGHIEPLVVEYSNRRMFIAPKNTVSLEIPIRNDYAETEIYFKVQILVVYQEKAYFFIKETNKIFLTKVEY